MIKPVHSPFFHLKMLDRTSLSLSLARSLPLFLPLSGASDFGSPCRRIFRTSDYRDLAHAGFIGVK